MRFVRYLLYADHKQDGQAADDRQDDSHDDESGVGRFSAAVIPRRLKELDPTAFSIITPLTSETIIYSFLYTN